MKKILFLCFAIFAVIPLTGGILADTVNIDWMVDGQTYAQTTCNPGDDLILPTTPTKYGYTFQGWELPYTALQYIESAGTQYIQTNIFGSVRIVVTAQATIIKGASQVLVCSSNGADAGTWFGEAANTRVWGVGGAGGGITSISPTTKITADLNFDNTGVRGTVNNAHIYRDVNIAHQRWSVFASDSGNYKFSGKIWGIKFYRNNELIGDMIPARRNSDNAIGMYDLVSKSFFGNAGTGTFIAGPDL